ncbi:MAG TPA: M23 family metallopeptidase [Thermoleophilaceae bacterium]|nr:M23 family metallopeptidase [Thermoleophilaceae bacterium]
MPRRPAWTDRGPGPGAVGPSGPRRPWLLGSLALVAALVAAALATGVLESAPESGAEEAASPEPRLDGTAPARAREQRKVSANGPRPKVVQVVPPGGGAGPRIDEEEEEPPARVLRENKKLRGELSDLKALEAARRRVARRLAKVGAIYDGPLRLGAGGLAWPVGGSVVSPFGQRWGRLHAGIDIAAPAGTVIRAAADGGVVIRGPVGGYGNYVCVQHTARLTTCYAHLSRFLTERGRVVKQGEPIGLVGCTGRCFGDHLHFETWVGGRPVDPMPFL